MTATATPISEYLAAPNRAVSAANGIDYAYRQVGEGTPALVLLQHFRGNLDNWDPALVDALARDRRVVTFDNAGVAGSAGTTPSTITQMARDAIAFLEALELGAVDLLGFSLGSFVAQEIALIRPAVARRVVLASAAPRAAARHARLAPRGDRSRRRARAQRRRVPRRLLHALGREPASGRGDAGATDRTERRSRQACELAVPAGSIRRRVRLGHPGPRPAAARQRDRHARVRGQRRQRPDDPAPLLLSACRPDPAGAGEDLPGRGARVPVPAPRRVTRRRSHSGSRRRARAGSDAVRAALRAA